MTERPERVRRILVALDSSQDALAALRVAARLAAERDAQLVGVFVEDPELLNAASHPFSQALGAQSLRWQSLDAATMQRALRAHAEQLRRAVAAAAGPRRLPWEFHVARGAIAERLVEEAREVELMVLGRTSRALVGPVPLGGTARRAVVQARCSVLVSQPTRAARRPVTVLYEGSAGALMAGTELARAHDIELEVLVVAPDEAMQRGLEQRAAEWLARHAACGRVEIATGVDPEALASRVSSDRSRLAVIDATGPVLGRVAIDALLDRLDVPAYVAR